MGLDPSKLSQGFLRAVHREPVFRTETPGASPLAPKTTIEPGTVHFVIPGPPIGKPRQTQSDRWRKRPCVVRYWEWADKARAAAPELPKDPLEVHFKAYLPIPPSYSAKKREAVRGKYHRFKPDVDNIWKCCDAFFEQDCMISVGSCEKRWDDGNGPRLEVWVK